MKPILKLSLACTLAAAVIAFAGCGTFGSNPSPPSKLESGIFNVTTNYVPVVVPVTSYRTNVVEVTQTVTNTAGGSVTLTNWTTNVVTSVVTQTNLQPQYNYTPGAGAQTATGVVTGIGNIFGVGGMAGTALGGLLSIWGWLRSTKNYATAANTAQVVETLRQFIQSLPNGSAYDTALTNFMTQHQSEAGVLANVTQILANDVSNPDAKFAAQSVIASLQALGIVIPPTAPKV